MAGKQSTKMDVPPLSPPIPEELVVVVDHVDRYVQMLEDRRLGSEQFIIPFELSAKERSVIHEYVRSKGFFSEPVNLKGSCFKKIRILAEEQEKTDSPPDEAEIDLFASYTKIPFPCSSPDLVEYYVEAFDRMYGSKELWNLYCDERREFKMKDEIHDSMGAISDYIRGNAEYKLLESRKLQRTKGKGRDVYNFSGVGKVYLSVDIKMANFTTLKMACPSLFMDENDGEQSWPEFVQKFTKSKFIAHSKPFREIVLGKIGFHKASTLQGIFMDGVHQTIISEPVAQTLTLWVKSGDENVYEISDPEKFMNSLDSLRSKVSDEHGRVLHFRVFQLESIENKPYFLKSFLFNTDWYNKDGAMVAVEKVPLRTKVQFMKVPKKFMLQVLKWYNKEKITDEDLYFLDEGILSKYCETIFQ